MRASTRLLRYLESAIESQRRCMSGVVSAPPSPVLCMHRRAVTPAITTTTTRKRSRVSRTVKTPEQVYNERCKALDHEQNWEALAKTVQHGEKEGLKLTMKMAKRLTTSLTKASQYVLALRIFTEYFENSESVSEPVVSRAITAASLSGNHAECERIYYKYRDLVSCYRIWAHHALLKSYIRSYDFTTAREVLHQLDNQKVATEETLRIYMIGVSKLANNVEELVREFERWVNSSSHIISATSYATFFECLMLLDLAKFEQVSDAAQHHGRFLSLSKRSPEMEHVWVLHALLTQNEKELVKHINYIGKGRNQLDRKPFLLAMKQFVSQGDIERLGFATGALTKAGFELDTEAMNLIGRAMYKEDPMFNAARFVEEMNSRNPGTIRLVANALMRRSVNKHHVARRLGYEPHAAPWAEQTIQRIKDCAAKGEAERGVELVKEFGYRGVKPPRQVYMALLRALCKNNHVNLLYTVCEMMHKDGYQPDASVELILLRADLAGSNDETIAKLDYFVSRHDLSALSIHDLSSLGTEYIRRQDYAKAARVLGAKQPADSEVITIQSHDCVSLKLMIQCYRKGGSLNRVIETVELLLNGAGQPSIPLQPYFIHELQKSLNLAIHNNNTDQAMQLWSQISQCKEYRQNIIQQTEVDLLRVNR